MRLMSLRSAWVARISERKSGLARTGRRRLGGLGLGCELERREVPSCLAWGNSVSSEFRDKVNQVAADLHTDPSNLMAAMAFETGGTFSPSVANKKSKATGLIQFTQSTAKSLGTTTGKLALMSPEAQLDYVARYFARQEKSFGALNSLEDVYAAILYPKSVGKSNDFVDFDSKSKSSQNRLAYQQNKGLDANHDGKVTKGEASAKVQARLAQGQSIANCYSPPTPASAEPLIVVGTHALTFTATQGGPDPAPQSLLVANFGAIGSVLNFRAIASDIVTVRPDRTELLSGDLATCVVSVSTAGLAAGTYEKVIQIDDPAASNNPQVVNVKVVVQPKAQPTNLGSYAGQLVGTVANSASDSSDPAPPFTDSYGGAMTLAVKANPAGGYFLEFSTPNGLTTRFSHEESFDANINGSLPVASLGSFSFQVTMGDGKMVVQGQIGAGGVSGTWQFVQDDSSDTSDSGNGTFSLAPVP